MLEGKDQHDVLLIYTRHHRLMLNLKGNIKAQMLRNSIYRTSIELINKLLVTIIFILCFYFYKHVYIYSKHQSI